MNIRTVMSTPAVTAPPQTPIAVVAKLMADAGVGAVVVVDDTRAVGIVTDRDIVVRAVARSRPLDDRIDSVMTADLVTIAVNDAVERAYETFRKLSCRRLPVTTPDTKVVVGMLTVDDLVLDLSRRVTDLASPIAEEILDPYREPPVPVLPLPRA
jgi:signal-transduction protein with cAMP-binding, CBS, and nucleotidyltransferase domain